MNRLLPLTFFILNVVAFNIQHRHSSGMDMPDMPTSEAMDYASAQKLVDYVNSVQTSFTAKVNNRTLQRMNWCHMNPKYANAPLGFQTVSLPAKTSYPESFDSRTAWPNCGSIGVIRDQSACGSCWAFATAGAMSDRTCIARNGSSNPILSSTDILSCCGDACGAGCKGGYPLEAWRYWSEAGVPTGGDYGDLSTCRPYEISPCGYDADREFYRDCPDDDDVTPVCELKCESDAYPKSYSGDKHYGKKAYMVPKTPDAIKNEIMTNGPVVAIMIVYQDFYTYNDGVYIYTSGSQLGVHAVRIIGWGVEGNKPYWLVANSWGDEFGAERGFFKILRGSNHCGIETAVSAGLPL